MKRLLNATTVILICIVMSLIVWALGIDLSTALGVTSILGAISFFTMLLLLKYKKVKEGRFWKEMASISNYAYFLVGLGSLLCGVHYLLTDNIPMIVSFDTIGTILMCIGFLFPINNKWRNCK